MHKEEGHLGGPHLGDVLLEQTHMHLVTLQVHLVPLVDHLLSAVEVPVLGLVDGLNVVGLGAPHRGDDLDAGLLHLLDLGVELVLICHLATPSWRRGPCR